MSSFLALAGVGVVVWQEVRSMRELSWRVFREPGVVADDVPGPIEQAKFSAGAGPLRPGPPPRAERTGAALAAVSRALRESGARHAPKLAPTCGRVRRDRLSAELTERQKSVVRHR
ncbi:hypothetical protein [Streptomyces sp. NBC_00690]|uniref:hypothetical protein n=1 Tax=Streptomyces sp. NBC_00690 TaxID=2975808 RepID=UPI002E2A8403|nr:hypothetical protein [Streptomyces sp. NBC_00690]